MDNKDGCFDNVIEFFILIGFILCYIFIVLDFEASYELKGSQSYGAAVNNWLGIILSVINILVLYDLNRRVEKFNNLSNERNIRAERQLILVKLKNDHFAKFKDEWSHVFRNYVESPEGLGTNEKAYCGFRDVYRKYLQVEMLYDCQLIKDKNVIWWNKKFEELDLFYASNPYYDVAEDSAELTKKMHELFISIVNGFFPRNN